MKYSSSPSFGALNQSHCSIMFGDHLYAMLSSLENLKSET